MAGPGCSACGETSSVRYVARGSAFEPLPCVHEDPRREPCECGFGALRCAWCDRPLRETGGDGIEWAEMAAEATDPPPPARTGCADRPPTPGCDSCALAMTDVTLAALATG